jgi:hypothetical protein
MDELPEAEAPSSGCCSDTARSDDRGEESGLISGDATPSLRRLPLLLPLEKHINEEEDLDGPDLAKKTPPPTPILHKGSRQNLET